MNIERNGFDSIPQYENGNKVHHLYLDETQIAQGCILTSNLERTKIIADTFDEAEYIGRNREYITYTGEKHGVPMSVMSIGNGCMPIAIAVEELRHINCKTMIKVGTCGAILEDIEPGTIIIPSSACRCEGATLEYINLQYPAITDLETLFAIIESAKELGIKIRMGCIRTHDAVFMESPFAHVGMEQRLKQWKDLGVLASDNEVAAMLTISSILGLKAGAVLVAVDNYTTGKSIDFKNEYDKLIGRAIEIATLALSKLLRKE